MNEKTAVVALAALAQEARLRIFRALIGAGPDGLTPSALTVMLGLTGSNLSFHLKELARADLLTVERDGRQLFYRPKLDHMNALVGYLVDHCCQGQDCAPTPKRAKPCGTPTC
jgi:DNA-binding transcriptional ArsR family regulator